MQVAPYLDAEGREVTPKRTFDYDVLVVAVGSQNNDFGTVTISNTGNTYATHVVVRDPIDPLLTAAALLVCGPVLSHATARAGRIRDLGAWNHSRSADQAHRAERHR